MTLSSTASSSTTTHRTSASRRCSSSSSNFSSSGRGFLKAAAAASREGGAFYFLILSLFRVVVTFSSLSLSFFCFFQKREILSRLAFFLICFRFRKEKVSREKEATFGFIFLFVRSPELSFCVCVALELLPLFFSKTLNSLFVLLYTFG